MRPKRKSQGNSFKLDDMLSSLLGDSHFSDRRDNWLWCYLDSLGAARYDRHRLQGDSRNRMALSIEEAGISAADIKAAERDFLIPDEHLSWITESQRQHEWIKHQWDKRVFPGSIDAKFSAPPALHGKTLLIATIDCWDVNKREKLKLCAELEQLWSEQEEIDKKLEWIKEDEGRTCKLIHDWLRKHHEDRLPRRRSINRYESILLYFDFLDMTKLEKTACIASIRKLWRQELRREKNCDKGQCNLLLNSKAIKRLASFSKKHEIPRNRVIEILLQMEEEHKAYLKPGINALRDQP